MPKLVAKSNGAGSFYLEVDGKELILQDGSPVIWSKAEVFAFQYGNGKTDFGKAVRSILEDGAIKCVN